MQKEELAPGIMIFDNIFMDSFDYIKKIEDEKIEWNKAKVISYNSSNNNKGHLNSNTRDTDIIMLPHHLRMSNEKNKTLSDFVTMFHESIRGPFDYYSNHYGSFANTFYSPQLLRYGKGQRFQNHVDDHGDAVRRVSLTYYLNDEYEGGDVEFDKFNLKIKAKKNQLLLFPSNFMYSHEVYPVTEGLRYTVVQWIT